MANVIHASESKLQTFFEAHREELRGPRGLQGLQGVQGDRGEKGDDGSNGEGVPSGGTTGQVLKKTSNTDFDTEWADETAEDAVTYENDTDPQSLQKTAVTMGSRKPNRDVGKSSVVIGHNCLASGKHSVAQGDGTVAQQQCAHAEGENTIAGSDTGTNGTASHAEGYKTRTFGDYSHAEGTGATVNSGHTAAFVWSGIPNEGAIGNNYKTKGAGTFCINPINGTSGVWIGNNKLADLFSSKISLSAIDADSSLDQVIAQLNTLISQLKGE